MVETNTDRLELAKSLVPELKNWLRQCHFFVGDVKVSDCFPESEVGFKIEIGSTGCAVVQAHGFPEKWGDFPVRFWNSEHPDGVKGVENHALHKTN